MQLLTLEARKIARKRLRRALALMMLVGAGAAQTAPYTPVDGGEVLERLRASQRPQLDSGLVTLQQQQASNPEDVQLATRLAARYLSIGRSESDPRFLGYAQAVLAPWWKQDAPPNRVRLLRASLNQASHSFDAALRDLTALVRDDSGDTQAWLSLSAIYLVTGRTREAEAACAALARSAHSATTTLCYAAVMSRTGQQERAYELLDVLAARQATRPDATLQWIYTTQAEAALMSGDSDRAAQAFEKALAIDNRDNYLLTSYADFCLATGRPEAIIELLENENRDIGLSLRTGLALSAAGRYREAENYTRQLAEAFAAEERRGSRLHNREAALFRLGLTQEYDLALALAQANWAVQKEPIDAWLLLAAARASGQGEAAAPVKDWMVSSGIRDVRLQELIDDTRLVSLRSPGALP